MKNIKVGDLHPTWFSGREDGNSVVIAVSEYTGRYKEFFSLVLRLSAPNTKRGWLEMTV
jgi:hypothetical protein